MNWEEIKVYLPKFLSAESEKELFEGLKEFPINYINRFYSNSALYNNVLLQGDGIRDLPVINFPDTKLENARCLILSNTCDIDPENKRFFPSQIVYAPIFDFTKYCLMLKNDGSRTDQQIESHIKSIKEQKITQILYLPEINGILNESIVFFDRVQNISVHAISMDSIKKRKLFSLGNLGLYLFLLKLSIHFTRIRDHIDRGGGYQNQNPF
jgi:hypothetical protein